jgi:Cu-processing system permease protein
MRTIVKYVLLDLLRNKTVIVYTAILMALSVSVLGMDNNSSKGVLSLLNITLLFVPIISILFSTIYFFNSVEFIELLLAQPIKRRTMLMAEYAGVSFALSIAYLIGVGLPVSILCSGAISITLIISGLFLTLIFSSLSLLIFVLFKDKTKGIGAAIIIALFFTLLFDGLLLAFIYSFGDYPIDKPLLGLISLNPVDLARILVLLQLDVAVMMGYSGALFKKFLGSATGSVYTVACMFFWIAVPLLFTLKIFKRKDL